MVPHGDRSTVVIEPYLTDQWYVDAKTLAQPALEAVRAGKTAFVPKNWEKTYYDWMENIQPWCVSRQLWWGHQIPAWYGPDGQYFVAETEAEAAAEAKKAYGKDTPLTRDEDVLDTWFSSALWPFSTLGWPDEHAGAEALLPDRRPGHRLRHHLLLGRPHDDDGTALHEEGAVPHRLYPPSRPRREGRQDVEVEGQRHRPARRHRRLRRRCAALCARARGGARPRHQACRRSMSRTIAISRPSSGTPRASSNSTAPRGSPGFDPKSAKETLNRWIAHETAKAHREVTEAIESYRFNDAAGAAYRFVWNVYCDWYVELSKPVLTGAGRRGEDRDARDGGLGAR